MRHPYDYIAKLIATALTAWPFLCTVARAEIIAGVNISGSAEYGSNPYLLDSTDTSAVRGRVSISPHIEEKTARSSLSVSSDASFSKFSRRYRDAIDLSTQMSYVNSLRRDLSLHSGVSISSTIGGSYSVVPILPTDPVTPVPPLIDPGLVGFQERTTQAQASVGVSYSINNKSSMTLDYDGSIIRYPTAINRSEYSTVRQSVGYSRTISPRMSGGVSFGITRIDYLGTPLGDALIYSPSLNIRRQLNARWNLTAGLGVSYSSVNIGFGFKLKSTDLNGNIGLCRNDVRTSVCISAARSTSASSFDGVRTTSSIGLNYSYKLTPRSTWTVTGGYSRADQPKLNIVSPSADYVSASTSFMRRLGDRLSGTITAGYNRSNLVVARTNYSASIGINYSFGNL